MIFLCLGFVFRPLTWFFWKKNKNKKQKKKKNKKQKNSLNHFFNDFMSGTPVLLYNPEPKTGTFIIRNKLLSELKVLIAHII